ncbi:sporulation integral membrane protein YtvI [Brevibacillus sp. SYSU BS000544]|uniref:sporulation integral membrane protein YtvI n=1 Tax=Brevibacillus sp. SYSU BS000544 TaxID=3416443 RepID=UPI003CE45B69
MLLQLLTRIFQISRFLFVILIVLVSIYLIQFLTPLLFPFLIALIIAILVNRPVTFLSTKGRLPRWLAVLISLLLLLGLLGGVVTLIITETVVEIGHLITLLPTFANELTQYLHRTISQDFLIGMYNRFAFFYAQLDEEYRQSITENVGNTLRSISQTGQLIIVSFLQGVKNLLVSLPNLATVTVIALLGAFFISKDYNLWKKRVQAFLPTGVNRRLDDIIKDLRIALLGFVKAQLTLISLTAAIVIVGLLILRVDYAITIGLLTGVVDLLPYLGTGTVFIPWIIYLFFKGKYSLVIGLSILYGVVIVFRQIMEPKVLADNVGLDPLLTLIALFVGLKLFGFLGLVIGPVSLVMINAFIRARILEDIWKFIKGKPHSP